jgi:hypothetical protein
MFKVGDKVYNYQYGWGIVKEELTRYIMVVFDNCKSVSIPFYKDGKETPRSERPTLSFTEYTLQGFSQEIHRPLGVPRPLKVENVDIKKLWNTCEDFISFLESDEYHEDKIENYVNDVFGKAMESIYGKEVFKFINNRIE